MRITRILAPLLAAIALPVAALAGGPAGGPADPLGDLVPGMLANGDSWPNRPFPLAGGLAFTAADPWHGEELRVFDGHELRLVEDLWPGRAGWIQSEPVRLGSHDYFRGRDGVVGSELWRTDAGGTEFVPVVDLCPGPCRGIGAAPVAAGGLLFFGGNDGSGAGTELGVSDGTAEGTRVIEVCPGSCSANPSDFTEWNGRVYFEATGPGGRELWASDGTEGGTHRVADLCAGCDGSPRSLTPWGDRLYFVASGPGPALGSKLWRTDGTESGTELVAAISAHALTLYRDRLYFLNSGSVWRLWATDGTPAGTVPAAALPYGAATDFQGIAVAGGVKFLSVHDPVTGGGELWVYDGWGSRRVRGGFERAPLTLWPVGERVAFSASLGDPFDTPWISDGTPAGTYRLAEVWTGPGGTAFTEVGGRIVFSAGNETGIEPWISDGTPAGTRQLADVLPARPAGLTSPEIVSLGEQVVFRHRDSAGVNVLWISDGTAAGTEELLAWPELTSHSAIGGRLYLAGAPEGGPSGLWVTDGDGTAPELLAAVDAVRPTAAPGSVWFSTGTLGQQLWLSDGTAAGTRLVADVNPGYYSGPCPFPCVPAIPDYPRQMTFAGGSLFFVASEEGSPAQLWVSDGSAAGTVPVRAFPGTGPSFETVGPENLTPHAGGVLFTVFDPGIGTELWWSDGTPAGTVPVADIVPGAGSSRPRDLTAVGGATLFVAREPGVGDRLWRVDGAPPVATLVSDLTFDGRASQVGSLIGDGTRVFFPLYHHSSGQELWLTDGTPGGTGPVVDLRPGRAGSYPAPLAFAGGRLFFAADDGATGLELWVTDGTAAGTALVEDLTPGPEATQPDWAALAGDRLVFFGEDRARGLEPWGLDPAAVGAVHLELDVRLPD